MLTASLLERWALLGECMTSIACQTRPPELHVVGIDYERAGCIPTMNRLAMAALEASADYVALLADDDLAYPQHLKTLCEGAESGAQIVYSWCDVEGRDWNPNRSFDEVALHYENYIPSTSLISAELIAELDGWNVDARNGFEDWDFWLRALDAGAEFCCIEEITWRYRFGSWGNQSFTGRVA